LDAVLKEPPEYVGSLRLEGMLSDGTSLIAVALTPLDEPKRTAIELRNAVQEAIRASGTSIFAANDLKFAKPRINVDYSRCGRCTNLGKNSPTN
jgi:hypothetical protein